jgi:signal transduction histidine kinase
LIVGDDGRGFDVSAVKNNGGGLGLVTMEERANLIGGGVYIESEAGRGTTVHVHGPASPPAIAAS